MFERCRYQAQAADSYRVSQRIILSILPVKELKGKDERNNKKSIASKPCPPPFKLRLSVWCVTTPCLSQILDQS